MNYPRNWFVVLGLVGSIATPPQAVQSLPAPPLVQPSARSTLLFNRGIDQFVAGDYAGAIATYTIVLKTNPRWVDVYIARGEARRRVGDLQGAIADSTRALQLKPDSVDAWTNRCAARYAKGDYQAAIADCSQSVTLDPTDADAFYNRALAYRQQGAIQEALNDFQQAARLYQQQLDAQPDAVFSGGTPEDQRSAPMSQPSSMPASGGEPPLPEPMPAGAFGAPPAPITRGNLAQPRGRGIPGRRSPGGSR